MESTDTTRQDTANAAVLSAYTVPELRNMCRVNGLKIGGKKAEVIARILQHRVQIPATRQRTTLLQKDVLQMLKKLGQKPEAVSNCLKRAIQKCHVSLDGETPLENELTRGKCLHCSQAFIVKIKDVLLQSDDGWDFSAETGVESPHCHERQYISRMCTGRFDFDYGKFHKHCTKCPGFGKCIDDYRMAHCDSCNKHYFEGVSGFACDNCKQSKKRKRLGGSMDDYDSCNEDAFPNNMNVPVTIVEFRGSDLI